MRSLRAIPFVLLELVICTTQAIEVQSNNLLIKRQNTSNTTTLVLPIVAEPSQFWEGIDGTWSTFVIRVGTPASVFRVLPATSWQETWVVYGAAAGVCNATLGVAPDCQEDRGGVFDIQKTSSWETEKQRPLDLNSDLRIEGVGQYGFDNVGLGYSNTSGPLLQKEIVAAIVSNSYWFGILGLGFQPTNFTGYNDPQQSFAESLFAQGLISSRSWSYTAGAYYQLKSVFGSLIFGGYDASRFRHNNVIFNMAGDNMKDLIVTIRGISSGGKELMENPIFAYIDSSVAELWLPTAICDVFEREFGLQYDIGSGLYLLNDTAYTTLSQRKPEFTFTLSNQKNDNLNETIKIILPYAAFDLTISARLIPNRTERYFPIRRAPKGNQYILGRTFLQEAYVTAHYGDRVFNVSQCVFEDGLKSQIIALPERLPSGDASDATTPPESGNSGKLGSGTIAGIVIGILAVVAIIAIFFFLRRRKRNSDQPAAVVEPSERRQEDLNIDGKCLPKHEEQTPSYTNELEGRERVELDGAPFMRPAELAADLPASSNHKELGVNRSERIVGNHVGGSSQERDFTNHVGKSPISPTSTSEMSEKEIEESSDVVGTGREKSGKISRKPDLTISSTAQQDTDSEWQGWTPTSPVQRSGTTGSKFRESF